MITSFQGKYRWLSNFWPAIVTYDGEKYPSVEHAYQAAKTNNLIIRELIKEAETAGKAKRLGRSFDVREDWNDQTKLSVMIDLVKQKFQDSILKQWLKDTGDEIIIEGNTWGDTFWGICEGIGENHLGKIIMEIRSKL